MWVGKLYLSVVLVRPFNISFGSYCAPVFEPLIEILESSECSSIFSTGYTFLDHYVVTMSPSTIECGGTTKEIIVDKVCHIVCVHL